MVATGDLVAKFFRQPGRPAHEDAADPEDMQLHLNRWRHDGEGDKPLQQHGVQE